MASRGYNTFELSAFHAVEFSRPGWQFTPPCFNLNERVSAINALLLRHGKRAASNSELHLTLPYHVGNGNHRGCEGGGIPARPRRIQRRTSKPRQVLAVLSAQAIRTAHTLSRRHNN